MDGFILKYKLEFNGLFMRIDENSMVNAVECEKRLNVMKCVLDYFLFFYSLENFAIEFIKEF